MKCKIVKSITALVLVLAMATGMMVGYKKKAVAATTITVLWDGNGGKTSYGASSYYLYYNGPSMTLKPSSTNFIRSGYTATGFTVNGKTYSFGQSVTVTKNTSVVYNWKKNKCTVKIWDYAISGRGVSKVTPKKQTSVSSGTKFSTALANVGLSYSAPTGYTREWSFVSQQGISASTVITDDIYVYYVDTPKSCQVTFVVGNTKYSPQTYRTGDPLPYTHEVGELIGWTLDNDKDGNVVHWAGEELIIENSTPRTYRAVYLKSGEKSKDVTFILNKESLALMADFLSKKYNEVYKKYESKVKKRSFLQGLADGFTFASFALGSIPIPSSTEVALIAGALGFTFGKLSEDPSINEIDKILDTLESKYNMLRKAINQNYTWYYAYATINNVDYIAASIGAVRGAR